MTVCCPGHRRLGAAALADYRWIIAIDDYANGVRSTGDTVEGVLCEISPSDETELATYEQVSTGCDGKYLLPVQHAGAAAQALAYLKPLTTTAAAGPAYRESLRTATFVDSRLSEAYLARYILPFF